VNAAIRNAEEADAPGIASLLIELGYPTDTLEALNRLRGVASDPGARVFVTVAAGRIIAFLSAHVTPYFPTNSNILRVTALAVTASARRRGVGSQLLTRATELAAAQGCSGIEITTSQS